MLRLRLHTTGVTLIEVLVGAALIGLFFTGIVSGFQLALVAIGHTRAEAGALALANESIEYMRALPYDSVGTIGGIPSGLIPQNQTVALNGVTYLRRVLVQYIDAPDDGLGGADTNSITTDFKRVKVELSWTIRGQSRSVSLVTTIIPKGIETVAGGGTLTVHVFDADARPVPTATVHIRNTALFPTVDVTTYTNASGTVQFPGAPAGGGYEVSATKAGYSIDQTYDATAGNPNPNPPHASVVLGEISTLNFAIDATSDLHIRAVLPPSEEYTEDTFLDATGLADASGAVVAGGTLTLATTSSGYETTGGFLSVVTAPLFLHAWNDMTLEGATPSGSDARYRVYAVDGSGVATTVPEAVLPGNASGFGIGIIDLSGLSVSEYPRLALGGSFTSDGLTTPTLDRFRTTYMVADIPVPDVSMNMWGTKIIGSDASGFPILKYDETHTTDAEGTVMIPGLEWDQYDIALVEGAGYAIGDVCDVLPLPLVPGTPATSTLVLFPSAARTALVRVEASSGGVVPGASVRLVGAGSDSTEESSTCGHAFFSNLPSGNDYEITVTADGFEDTTVSGLSVSGTERFSVTLTEL